MVTILIGLVKRTVIVASGVSVLAVGLGLLLSRM